MSITFYISREEMKKVLESLGVQLTSGVDSVTIYGRSEDESSEAANG